jgi:hypothetical protein
MLQRMTTAKQGRASSCLVKHPARQFMMDRQTNSRLRPQEIAWKPLQPQAEPFCPAHFGAGRMFVYVHLANKCRLACR